MYKFDRFSYLYGYSAADGSLKWVNDFDELQKPIVEESMQGGRIGLRFKSGENKFRDSFLRTKTLKDNYQLVQIDRRVIPKKDAFISESEVLSFIIDSNTGESTYLGKAIPRIQATKNDLIIGVNSDYIEALILK